MDELQLALQATKRPLIYSLPSFNVFQVSNLVSVMKVMVMK